MPTKKARSVNSSVINAFQIIDYLTGKDWCRIKDIANALNLDVSTVHRLLNTMLTKEFVQFDPSTHRYKLGLKFFTIAFHMSQSGLISVSRSYMERAAAETGATINLGVLSNTKTSVVQMYRLDGDPTSRLEDIPLGVNKSIHASALGKCILAFYPFGEQRAALEKVDFKKYTDATITTPEALLDELDQIAKQGFALDNGEFYERLFCVAFPVHDFTGAVVAAISASMSSPLTDAYFVRLIDTLKKASEGISEALGYLHHVAE